MLSQEENLVMINEFLEKADQKVLVLALTPQGQIYPATSFPTSSKTKVYNANACVYLFASTCTLHDCMIGGVFCEEEGRCGKEG